MALQQNAIYAGEAIGRRLRNQYRAVRQESEVERARLVGPVVLPHHQRLLRVLVLKLLQAVQVKINRKIQ